MQFFITLYNAKFKKTGLICRRSCAQIYLSPEVTCTPVNNGEVVMKLPRNWHLPPRNNFITVELASLKCCAAV